MDAISRKKQEAEIAALRKAKLAEFEQGLDAILERYAEAEAEPESFQAPLETRPSLPEPVVTEPRVDQGQLDTLRQQGLKFDLSRDPTSAPPRSSQVHVPSKLDNDWEQESISAAGSLLSEWFSPLFGLFEPLKGWIKRAQAEGKLAMLLMSAMGVIALLMGSAYLIQLSLAYLNAESRSVLGFLAAASVVVLGIRLARRARMAEYASTLIGLGIGLGYLNTLAAVTYLLVIGPVTGSLVLAVITLLAYLLALRYETRIVATIAYLGGALTPLMLGAEGSPWGYLGYIALLNLMALHLAYQIRWPRLGHMAFITTLALLEMSVFNTAGAAEAALPWLALLICHLLAWQFILAVLHGHWFHQDKAKPVLAITVLIGSVLSLSVNLFLVLGDRLGMLGALYLGNALALGIYGYRSRFQAMAPVILTTVMLSALLVAFCIPALLGQDVLGLAWGAEALLLLMAARRLAIIPLARQGWALWWFTVLYCLGFSADDFLSALLVGDGTGFAPTLPGLFNYLLLGLLLQLPTQRMRIIKGTLAQAGAIWWLALAVSVWLLGLYLLVAHSLFPAYLGVGMIIPLYGLVYRGYRINSYVTAGLGLLCSIGILLALAGSITETQSLQFLQQTLIGKLAMVELLGTTLLARWFLRHFAPLRYFKQPACLLFIAGLLTIPVLVMPPLPSIWLMAQPWFGVALAVSVLTAYGLYTVRYRLPVLKFEFNLLVLAFAGYQLFSTAVLLTMPHQRLYLLADLLSIATLALFLLYREGQKPRSRHPVLLGLMPVYFALYPMLWLMVQFGDVPGGILLFGLTLILLSRLQWPFPVWINKASDYLSLGLLALLLVPVAALGMQLLTGDGQASWPLLTSVLISGAVLHLGATKLSPIRLAEDASEDVGLSGLWFVWNLHLAASYLGLNVIWSGGYLTIWLTLALILHAVAMVLIVSDTNRLLLRLAAAIGTLGIAKLILLDMSGAALVYKVVVFMGVGVILLAGTYVHQKQAARRRAPHGR